MWQCFVLFIQTLESQLRQVKEALGASEKRMDASKQELGRLRRTADNARTETQAAREEVNPSTVLQGHSWHLGWENLYQRAIPIHNGNFVHQAE